MQLGRRLRPFAILLLLLCSANAAETPRPPKGPEISSSLEDLKQKVANLGDEIAILRRDQLNHQTERDLLKDSFTANLQSINITVSIILGFLTLLGGLVGYIGFTSFNALKKDYTKEIDDLRALKITIEEEFRNILSQQQQVRIDVDKISKLNEEQERRLKILEITEKAGQYVANRNFSWALEYISNGLMLDPKDLRLLQMKSTCHGKLGEFASAIDALKRALEIDPESAPNINNLAEYFLLANQIEAFDAYRDAHKKVIEETYDGALLAYLLALRGFMRGSVPEIVAPVREYIQKASPGAKQHMGPWEFDESILLINGSNNAQAKAAMLEAINYFGGARPGESTFAYQPAEGPVAH